MLRSYLKHPHSSSPDPLTADFSCVRISVFRAEITVVSDGSSPKPLAHALSHNKVLNCELEEDPAYHMYDRNTCSNSQELFLSLLVRWLNMRSPMTTGILGHVSMGINTIRTRIPIPTITASQGGLYQPRRFHPLLIRCVRLQTLCILQQDSILSHQLILHLRLRY